MGIQIASAGALPPPWLSGFERVTVDPGDSLHRGYDGSSVLYFVVDGVLDKGEGPAGLRRALPGEVVVFRGCDAVTVSNASHVEPLALCVVALRVGQDGAPRTASRYFSDDAKSGALLLVACEDGRSGSLAHGAAPRLSLTSLARGDTVVHRMNGDGLACALNGQVELNGVGLEGPDCAVLSAVDELRISAARAGQLLLIEQ